MSDRRVRLDLALKARFPYYSRSQIQKLIEGGFVRVDGLQRKASTLLKGGEKIEVARRAPEIPEARPEPIPLALLYEDDDLMVINKPAGLVAHPAPGNPTGTLLNALLFHSAWVGLVHRLDKGTSGVLVAAKNEGAQTRLSAQFKKRTVAKKYLAIALGKFARPEGTIRRAVGRDRVHRRRFSSRSQKLREAVTHFRVLEEFEGLSFVELKPETGRTHQIRVHLTEEKHPIAGDTLYGAKSFLESIRNLELRERLERLDHPLLHAAELSFSHPTSGQTVRFEAPLPPDFREILEACRRR